MKPFTADAVELEYRAVRYQDNLHFHEEILPQWPATIVFQDSVYSLFKMIYLPDNVEKAFYKKS